MNNRSITAECAYGFLAGGIRILAGGIRILPGGIRIIVFRMIITY
jgi:hypothetical protein